MQRLINRCDHQTVQYSGLIFSSVSLSVFSINQTGHILLSSRLQRNIAQHSFSVFVVDSLDAATANTATVGVIVNVDSKYI